MLCTTNGTRAATEADEQFSNILLADIILTGMIAYGLWKSKTGWKDTDAMIKRIIMQVNASRPLVRSWILMPLVSVVKHSSYRRLSPWAC